jgi:hypothetical protein
MCFCAMHLPILMITGYTRPLSLLPFDHRASSISGLFGWKEPLNVEQMVTVANSKQVIYAGFQRAIADQMPKDRVGLLVDEEFGAAILRDAVSKGSITVASVEKSGQEDINTACFLLEVAHPHGHLLWRSAPPEKGPKANPQVKSSSRRAGFPQIGNCLHQRTRVGLLRQIALQRGVRACHAARRSHVVPRALAVLP